MITIHDGNWEEFAAKHKPTNLCSALPATKAPFTYCGAYSDAVDLIPESQYSRRYDYMRGRFIRQKKESFKPKHKNQGNHPACWRYALAQHLECCRAKMNLPYVELAPESISGTFGWADEGGALDDAIDWIKENGVAPRSLVPQYNFNPNSWNPTWKDAAKNVVPLEYYQLGKKDMWAETMTALLNGDSVYFAVMWLMHAMNAEELQKRGNEYGIWTPNTWPEDQDMLLLGKKKIFDDAFVVREVTYSR